MAALINDYAVQLAPYGVFWVVFGFVAYLAGRRRGVIVTHVLIAAVVVALDVGWVMQNGLQPSQTDLGIAIAIATRACLISMILLPLSVPALKSRRLNKREVQG